MAEVVGAPAGATPRPTRYAQLSRRRRGRGAARRGLTSSRRCASTTARRSPTAPPPSILAAGDVARELSDRPAWIRGFDHRIEPHALGVRDLTTSVSTTQAGEQGRRRRRHGRRGRAARAVHATRSSSCAEALGLGDDVAINPSGGALCRQPDHGGRPHPHRRGRHPHHQRRGRPGRRPRHLGRVPATEPRLRPGGGVMGKERVAIVGIGQTKHQTTARRRVDRRAGARGGRSGRSTTPR